MKTLNPNKKIARLTRDIFILKQDLSRTTHASIKRWTESAIAQKETALRLIAQRALTKPGHTGRKTLDGETRSVVK